MGDRNGDGGNNEHINATWNTRNTKGGMEEDTKTKNEWWLCCLLCGCVVVASPAVNGDQTETKQKHGMDERNKTQTQQDTTRHNKTTQATNMNEGRTCSGE